MNKHLKNLFVGVGSVMIVAPITQYMRDNRSDADRLDGDWIRIGADIRNAFDKVTNEQTKEEPK